MAYDSENENVVLFGGMNESDFLNDTWLWDGESWREVCSEEICSRPTARSGHSMAYDRVRGRTVLVGGNAQKSLMG